MRGSLQWLTRDSKVSKNMKKTYKSPMLRRIEASEIAYRNFVPFRQVKYLTAQDHGSMIRTSYLIDLLPHATIMRFDLAFESIPRSDTAMDLLVVGCEDPMQARTFMEANLPVCRAVPRVLLAANLSRNGIAGVLNSGFDDVILAERIDIDEAAARLISLRNRYRATRGEGVVRKRVEPAMSGLCDTAQLTPVQRRILGKLADRYGRTVSCETLYRVAAATDEPTSAETLRVQISRLRRHLRAGHFIESVYGEGYRLRNIADQTTGERQ